MSRLILTNVAAWRHLRLRPRVLVDVGRVTAASTMLGAPVSMPVAIAPMAVHGLAHADGEVASARAAEAAGVPFTLSTMSSRSIEDIAAAAPGGTRWFQLYTQAEPGQSQELVERAAAAGFSAIILTVDLPRLAYRDRDRRSGIRMPALGNFPDRGPSHRPIDKGEPLAHATLTWADLAEIRSWSNLPIVLKGILTAEDARLAVEHGVDAIVVSNHGARQLDRVGAAVDALPAIAEAVAGRTELWVDGGVRRGIDVVTALALGARGVLVGRPILWALAAGGEAGVARALEILREETETAMALLGTPSTDAVTPAHVEPVPSSM